MPLRRWSGSVRITPAYYAFLFFCSPSNGGSALFDIGGKLFPSILTVKKNDWLSWISPPKLPRQIVLAVMPSGNFSASQRTPGGLLSPWGNHESESTNASAHYFPGPQRAGIAAP